VECCEVALLARQHLRAVGLEPLVKTSGSKGLQVLARAPAADTSAFA
jgi:DNA primase